MPKDLENKSRVGWEFRPYAMLVLCSMSPCNCSGKMPSCKEDGDIEREGTVEKGFY